MGSNDGQVSRLIELLIMFGALLFVGALLLGALKILFVLVLLPLKIGFWILKGVVGLLLFIPVVLFSVWLLSCVYPIIVAVILVPILIVVAGIISLANVIF
jgi:hypothetical protein